ncbi:MAG: response regulator [Candidatus Marinimicrobia bacterium]|nr:response regulator [Candidatus Neomarinimicrobiota bacterium]
MMYVTDNNNHKELRNVDKLLTLCDKLDNSNQRIESYYFQILSQFESGTTNGILKKVDQEFQKISEIKEIMLKGGDVNFNSHYTIKEFDLIAENIEYKPVDLNIFEGWDERQAILKRKLELKIEVLVGLIELRNTTIGNGKKKEFDIVLSKIKLNVIEGRRLFKENYVLKKEYLNKVIDYRYDIYMKDNSYNIRYFYIQLLFALAIIFVIIKIGKRISIQINEDQKKLTLVKENAEVFADEINRRAEEVEETNTKLNKAKLLAEDAVKAKSEFLANMSHEIRTPMNGVIGMCDLLLDTELETDQFEYAGIIRNSADALLIIINDILDFSKMEAGKLELENIKFDLQTSLEDIADIMAYKAQQKNLQYTTDIDLDVKRFLIGDPGRLRQVLINLIGNSIKFTSEGEISISVNVEKETEGEIQLKFMVRDTGIGIPEDKTRSLFESFTQVDASITRQYGGTGLGLSISKQLTRLMDGEIGVFSELDKGSVFWFTSKFKKQKEQNIKYSPKIDIRQEKIRILIVDDNETNRLVLARQLKAWDFNHSEADSATRAMEMLKKSHYDIVFTDMQMPDMSGEELGIEIRKNSSLNNTNLVMMTSIGKRGDAARMYDVGFAAFLSKPLKLSMLKDCVEQILGSKQVQDSEKKELITKYTLAEDNKHDQKILLVEDNAVNQMVAKRILAKLGYSCDIAENGAKALEHLAEKKYDILLMDCQMPIMDGYTATSEIRSWIHSGDPHLIAASTVPVIAMTANSSKEDKARCIESGMNKYLSKPINLKELSSTLEETFRKIE